MKDPIKKSLKITTGLSKKQAYNTELTLTPYLVEKFKPSFEIEFLQGESVKLRDGRVRIKCNLSDEKIQILKRAISNACFGNPDANMS